MDIKLQNKQIEQLSLALSVDDVLNFIENNKNDYLLFLNEELESKNISLKEYNNEISYLNILCKEEFRNE